MNREPFGPVAEMLKHYANKRPARFHMPGHKGFLNPLDVTELSETDNLLIPENALKQAQEELAQAYGAGVALFCTGGSTAGVIAMLLTLPQGSTVALARTAHRSAVSALILGGHKPVWLLPDDSGQVPPAAVEQALTLHPETKAVLLTSPDYLGQCADLSAISAICRSRSALLLVDGAHGAHFALSSALPPSPSEYADLWVTSAHKTLFCENQGAYLFGKDCEEARRLKDALFLLHTTSPSFPLLASLDEAWRRAKAWDYAAHIRRLDAVRQKIAVMEGLDPNFPLHPSVPHHDPTRLVVRVCRRGITGYEAEEHLRARNVFLEMADMDRIVAITSPIDPDDWYEKLITGLSELPLRSPRPATAVALPPLPKRELLPREAAFLPRECMPLSQAAGRICAECFGVYPPGCAAGVAGERLDDAVIQAVFTAQRYGGTLFGVTEGRIQVIMEQ